MMNRLLALTGLTLFLTLTACGGQESPDPPAPSNDSCGEIREMGACYDNRACIWDYERSLCISG